MNLDALNLAVADPSGMGRRISALPSDSRAALEAAALLDWAPRPAPRAALICGMGGSAISGELLRAYLEPELSFPIVVCRDYRLPGWAGPDCLVIACSYSGNTEETLAAYAQARERSIPAVAISSGGELRRRALADGVPFAPLPGGSPPRAALGRAFFTLLGGFVRLGLAGSRDREAAQAIRAMEARNSECQPEQPESLNPAKGLAHALFGKLPVLYTAVGPMEAVALRWRQQLNENSKVLAHTCSFPEQNHNEIVGWEALPDVLRRVALITFADRGDGARVRRRLELTAGLVAGAAGGVYPLSTTGDSLLERMFSLLVLGDWVSLYLSFLNQVDPTPVKRIDHLKSELENAGAS